MKTILEFNLPDDKEEFRTAVNAGKYVAALDGIKSLLRTMAKYGCSLEQLRLHSKKCTFDYENAKDYVSPFHGRNDLNESEIILLDYVCEQIAELIPELE